MSQRIKLPYFMAETADRHCQARGSSRRCAVGPRPHVRVLLDIPYGDDIRNKLDLYLPSTHSFPIAMFVHGGSWSSGDKALYGHLGNFLASHGIGAVLVNYRLSPSVSHPNHVQDVATAVAWTHNHLKASGGDPERLFLFGHSAGGHMVSLLATDSSHLRPWGLSPNNLRGVISVSGVYRIHLNVNVTGLGHVFRGADKRAASPLCHVKPGCPPFFILHAQREIWTLAGQARRFHARVRACTGRSQLMRVPGQNHVSIIHSAVIPGARHGDEIVRFIRDESQAVCGFSKTTAHS